MENKNCAACGQTFQPRPQVPQQAYCSAPACQQQRRQQWLRLKLKADPDYRDNQTRAQQAWIQRNPDYWRQYRESHPDYVDRNRAQQRGRDSAAATDSLAKMDASKSPAPLPSGLYRLIPVVDPDLAKMDVWIVEITVRDRQTFVANDCFRHGG